MSFLDRLKRGAKAFTLYFSRGVGRWGFGLGSTRYDYEASVANAGGNAIVAACVKWACRTFPEAPPMVEQRTTKGWEPNDDHPLLGLLHRPNPYYSGLHLWSATLADYMLTGNAYWLKRRSAANRVVELWWVPSSIIEPKWPDNDTVYIGWYEYRHSQSSDPALIDPADVVHFRNGFDPANIRKGLSDLAALYREVATDNEAANWSASLLRNMGVPGVIISPGGDAELDERDAEGVKASFQARFSGDQRGAPMVMSGKTTVSVLSFNPEQMQLRELRRIPEERVSAIFGTPAVVVGLGAGLDRSTYSNMAEAREAAYESNIIPTQRLFAAEMDTQLVPDFGDPTRLRVGFDLSKVRVLQDDQNALHERARLNLGAGLLTLNQALEMIGEEALPGPDGEIRFLPSNVTPTVADDLLPPEPEPVPAALQAGQGGEDEEEAQPALPPGQPPKRRRKAARVLPLPDGDVPLGPDDARRALALWDILYPDYAGLLDARLIGNGSNGSRN
jgi:HK97 family phage portal protein